MQFQKRPCYLSIFHHLLLSNCSHFLLKLDFAVAHPLMKRAQLARGRDPTSSCKPGIKSHNRVTSPEKSGGGTSLKCFSYILPFPRMNKSNLSVFFYWPNCLFYSPLWTCHACVWGICYQRGSSNSRSRPTGFPWPPSHPTRIKAPQLTMPSCALLRAVSHGPTESFLPARLCSTSPSSLPTFPLGLTLPSERACGRRSRETSFGAFPFSRAPEMGLSAHSGLRWPPDDGQCGEPSRAGEFKTFHSLEAKGCVLPSDFNWPGECCFFSLSLLFTKPRLELGPRHFVSQNW